MRVAIYCRISMDRTGEGAGVGRQREDCIRLVEEAGWTVYEVYTDNDLSATSGKPRPEYRRMLREIQSGNIDALVAWHPDRLYRKLPDLEELIAAVEKRDVAIRTVRYGDFDLATPTGRMIARILASVATGEGEQKADRWLRSVRQRREAGEPATWGPRMYGWTRDGQIIEAEAEVIRWMADEVLRGAAFHRICHDLHERGVKTSQGGPWSAQGLKRLLTNPRLAGHSTLNGEIVGTSRWQPILDDETWEAARALCTARSRKSPPRVSLLVGLIKCSCGANMVTGARMKRDKTTQRVYRCTRRPGSAGCGKISARADIVEEIVEAFARERLNDERVRASVAHLSASPAEHAAEIGALEIRIRELEAELDEPGVPVKMILRAVDRARERLEELQRAVTTVPPRLPERGAAWPEDLARRRALVNLVVEEVTIDPATRTGVFGQDRVRIKGRT